METLIIILAIAAGIIGIAGSILPGLPGPPVSWVGMLLLYLWGSGTNADGLPMSTIALVVWGVVVVVVSVIDYVVPMYFTKLTEYRCNKFIYFLDNLFTTVCCSCFFQFIQ